jgi:hypothetical protein
MRRSASCSAPAAWSGRTATRCAPDWSRRAPCAEAWSASTTSTSTTPDAGRVESELRARGIAVLDTTYGAHVTLRLGVHPEQEERLATVLAELTAGTAKTTVAGERWVDSLDA